MRDHNSQAYRKMDVTREHFSHILERREILLSFQAGFNLVNTAVVCAVLESISGLEPSSVITEPRYLKLVTVSSFCPFTLICVDATGVICHQLGLLGTDLHAVGYGGFAKMSCNFAIKHVKKQTHTQMGGTILVDLSPSSIK